MIKKLVIVALAVVAFGGTMSAYAWWDTLEETQSETLTIGEGTNLILEVNATAPAGKVLVPSGVIMGINDVNEIVLSYDINLSKETQSDLTLNINASNVLIDGAADYASLVNIVISPSTTNINNGVVTVTVTITLSEPTTLEIYEAIFDGNITFDLTFVATQ